MEQVENFKENEDVDYNEVKTTYTPIINMYPPTEEGSEMMMAAEKNNKYGSTSVDQPNKKRE